MENLKLTRFMKNLTFSNITKEELDDFFSTGYTKLAKERCAKNYTMFDYKQGILKANHLVKNDDTRHIVDLMMFALAKIEDLQLTVSSLEEIIKDFEKSVEQEIKKEEQKTSTSQNKKEV